MERTTEAPSLLREAAAKAGLRAAGAELIRLGENALYRLPGGVVARISRAGQQAAAAKEVLVSRWLERAGVDAARVLSDVEQPIEVDGRAVTFWHELPPHVRGTTRDVARVLRHFHALPPPDFELPPLSPFVRLPERIERADFLTSDDRAWMCERLAELRHRYVELPPGRPSSVVHGDAWVGNVAVTEEGRAVLHDFERCSLGPPEWDSIHSAIKHSSFGWEPPDEYAEFVSVYGHDVTEWEGFATLRDIREFRMTCMAVQIATEDPRARDQAFHRLACIRGERGTRPWSGWRGVPF